MNKIMEGFKTLKGNPVRIEGVSRDALPEFLVEMGYTRGAEIGVYKGEYLKKFCDAGLVMYGVDPWKAFYGQGRTQQVQKRQDFIFTPNPAVWSAMRKRWAAACACTIPTATRLV